MALVDTRVSQQLVPEIRANCAEDILEKSAPDRSASHVQVDVACALQVWIKHAERSIYVAEIDGCMLMKMGPAKYQPEEAHWRSVASGHHWEIWEKVQQH